MNMRILALQFLVAVLIVVLDIHFGIDQMYFWSVWWWDVLMHVLGGVWAGLFGAWCMRTLGYRVSLSGCVLAAFSIGLAWEIFEYVFDIGGSVFMSYPVDTAKDIIDDSIGGILAYYAVVRSRS